ncbi:ABC transporter permease [Ruicaihuangia caeni]|uniref:ABC transporter permease n=1 Tax=Ruicaihuangia caeni TaxID=3042517 RepID=UPI00338E47E3
MKKKPSLRRRRVQDAVLPVVGIAALAVTLEVVSTSGVVDSRFLPSFSQTVAASVQLLFDPVFLVDLGTTVATFVLGLLLACVVGIGVGVLVGLSETAYRAMRPVVELVRPVPPVALIPLAILVLGVDLEMKVAVALFAAVWPVLFNTMYGVHGVDPLSRDMALSFGRSNADIIRTVVIPAAGPQIWTGVRMSTTISLLVIITLELIAGSNSGIGAFIAEARSASETHAVYAALVVSGFLGLAINQLMMLLERVLFRWSLTEERG